MAALENMDNQESVDSNMSDVTKTISENTDDFAKLLAKTETTEGSPETIQALKKDLATSFDDLELSSKKGVDFKDILSDLEGRRVVKNMKGHERFKSGLKMSTEEHNTTVSLLIIHQNIEDAINGNDNALGAIKEALRRMKVAQKANHVALRRRQLIKAKIALEAQNNNKPIPKTLFTDKDEDVIASESGLNQRGVNIAFATKRELEKAISLYEDELARIRNNKKEK